MRGIGELPAGERAGFGARVNDAKGRLEQALASRRAALVAERLGAELSDTRFDPTEPALAARRGHLHPITQVRREIEAIFIGLGFDVVDGPEVETEEFNFDRLNIPSHHPARDMQDTFWLENGQVLRTHTSPVQLAAMLAAKGRTPLRVIAPGRVFRNEQPDATHEHTFHQVEGLMIDEGVGLADMKGVLEMALSRLLGQAVEVRLRPHYFPFVEPASSSTCGRRERRRLDGDARLRHGPPAGAARRRHGSRARLGLGLRHGPRPDRDGALRHRRPALDDERRPPVPAAVLRPRCSSR
jgi:phenylalanyl-tRNA synthetase alpha chain